MKNKYDMRNDLVIFEAATNFFDHKRPEPICTENDLTPFSQSYKNAYMTFGYKKSEKKHHKGFELCVYTRISAEVINNKIFNRFELYQLHQL